MLGLVPELVGLGVRPPRLLPKRVGALTDDLIVDPPWSPARATMRIPWYRVSDHHSADMHLGVQAFEFLVRHQLRVTLNWPPNAFRLNASSAAGWVIVTGNVCRTFLPCFSTSTKRSGMKASLQW